MNTNQTSQFEQTNSETKINREDSQTETKTKINRLDLKIKRAKTDFGNKL